MGAEPIHDIKATTREPSRVVLEIVMIIKESSEVATALIPVDGGCSHYRHNFDFGKSVCSLCMRLGDWYGILTHTSQTFSELLIHLVNWLLNPSSPVWINSRRTPRCLHEERSAPFSEAGSSDDSATNLTCLIRNWGLNKLIWTWWRYTALNLHLGMTRNHTPPIGRRCPAPWPSQDLIGDGHWIRFMREPMNLQRRQRVNLKPLLFLSLTSTLNQLALPSQSPVQRPHL